MPIRDVDSFGLTTDVPVAISANRGLNGIDGALATTFGIAARWSEPVVALIGDLTFLHDLGSLTLARARSRDIKTSLTVVVVDNGGGAIFGTLPIAAHPMDFEDHFLTPQEMNIPALCAAADIPCESVMDRDAFTALLDRNIQTSGLHVIHVVVNRDEDRVRHTSTRDAVLTKSLISTSPHEVS